MTTRSDRMSEAEVSLRLAIDLLSRRMAVQVVSVAIDGAQVQTGQTVRFPMRDFMATLGWAGDAQDRCQTTYRHRDHSAAIEIHSRPGLGDVVATLSDGIPFIAEAKKGPLARSKSSAEFPLLREALGQLLTIDELPENAMLAVAVPHSPKFVELASRWRKAPLVRRVGIHILTVSQDGSVAGW